MKRQTKTPEHLKTIEALKRATDNIRQQKELRNKAIVLAYEGGQSVKKIATSLGLTPEGIYNILERHGVNLIMRGEETIDRDQAIVQAYTDGKSGVEIASENDLTPVSVYQILKRNNVPTHTRRKERTSSAEIAARNRAIILATYDGHTTAKIVQDFGITKINYYQILRKNGVKRALINEKQQIAK